jgi:iron(III) transport system ATP-binding protein
VIIQGSIRQIGSPTAIYDFPGSIEVARFVGIENFIPGTLRHLDTPFVEFRSSDIGPFRWPMRERPPEGGTLLGIRPHALVLCPIDSFRDGRYSWIEGKVAASEFLGESVRYLVAIGATGLAVREAHFPGSPATPPGTPVLVGFDPARIRLFSTSNP